MNIIVGYVGVWLLSDGIYSISLYLNSLSYNGEKQSWRRDHWIRVIRCLLGIVLMYLGGS